MATLEREKGRRRANRRGIQAQCGHGHGERSKHLWGGGTRATWSEGRHRVFSLVDSNRLYGSGKRQTNVMRWVANSWTEPQKEGVARAAARLAGMAHPWRQNSDRSRRVIAFCANTDQAGLASVTL